MPTPEIKEAPGLYNGLTDKILLMRRYYRESVMGHPEVREWAEGAVGRGPRKDQAMALYHAVQSRVNYVGDPEGYAKGPDFHSIELIKAPWTMIDEIESRGFSAGDCDDQASLNYTLLQNVGIEANLRVIWTHGSENPTHIYALANIDGTWYAFDTCAPGFGVEKGFDAYADFT